MHSNVASSTASKHSVVVGVAVAVVVAVAVSGSLGYADGDENGYVNVNGHGCSVACIRNEMRFDLPENRLVDCRFTASSGV